MWVNLYYVDPKSEPLLENNMISANEEYNLQELSNSLKWGRKKHIGSAQNSQPPEKSKEEKECRFVCRELLDIAAAQDKVQFLDCSISQQNSHLEASSPGKDYTLWISANSWSNLAPLFRKPALVVVTFGFRGLIRGCVTKSGRDDSSSTNPS